MFKHLSKSPQKIISRFVGQYLDKWVAIALLFRGEGAAFSL